MNAIIRRNSDAVFERDFSITLSFDKFSLHMYALFILISLVLGLFPHFQCLRIFCIRLI